ncbi:hypothetical protein [Streptomyces fructofermentans]|uniref:hypothetical protein n=1 Tax=Streptomyces fructofermentans TaxID=152141 RepID=UPI00167564BA|nr:hypothetical protein [Streptomyces fructofermentans]
MTTAVDSLVQFVRRCCRGVPGRARVPRGDPLLSLVRTAQSLRYGAGEFLGPPDDDD